MGRQSDELDPLRFIDADTIPSAAAIERELRQTRSVVRRLRVLLLLARELEQPAAGDPDRAGDTRSVRERARGR